MALSREPWQYKLPCLYVFHWNFRVCYRSCNHIMYINKNRICYSSKKIMRDKALWVGSLMYGIRFTLGHSCVRKSHQLFSCEFAKLVGMVLWGRISWCLWQSRCIFPAVIWEMQAVLKGVSFYPVYDWWINCPSHDVKLLWDIIIKLPADHKWFY